MDIWLILVLLVLLLEREKGLELLEERGLDDVATKGLDDRGLGVDSGLLEKLEEKALFLKEDRGLVLELKVEVELKGELLELNVELLEG
jgi:hypothetical protein